MDVPIVSCQNGHSCCLQCVLKMDTQLCPYCKSHFSSVNVTLRSLTGLFPDMIVMCKNSCNQLIRYVDSARHTYFHCAMNTVRCPTRKTEACNRLMSVGQVINHCGLSTCMKNISRDVVFPFAKWILIDWDKPLFCRNDEFLIGYFSSFYKNFSPDFNFNKLLVVVVIKRLHLTILDAQNSIFTWAICLTVNLPNNLATELAAKFRFFNANGEEIESGTLHGNSNIFGLDEIFSHKKCFRSIPEKKIIAGYDFPSGLLGSVELEFLPNKLATVLHTNFNE